MAEKPVVVLEAPVHTWGLDPEKKDARRFAIFVIPFGVARQAFKPDPFAATKGSGEQRALHPAQVRKLKAAMLDGSYTPTAVAVGLRPRHLEAMKVKSGVALLAVYASDPLPQTDGQQRFGALADIRAEAEKAGNEALVAAVDASPIPVVLNIDGDTKRDFINLQLGQTVDAAHMMSLKVKAGLFGAKEKVGMQLTFDAAKALAGHADSPFHKVIRFDTRAVGTALMKLPVTTLAARGASDLSTSLVGLAKVGGDEADPVKLAFAVVSAFKAVQEKAVDLLAEDRPLTPPSENGTKGSATMLVGLGVCLAYRMKALGRDIPEADDLEKLVKAAKKTMNKPVTTGFSAATKRALMGEFAAEYLKDLKEEKHEGVPVNLLRTLSCSAFAVAPLPRPAKAKLVLPEVDDVPWEQAAKETV